MSWAGWILSVLMGLFMLTSGINLIFIRTAEVQANFTKFGYPENTIGPIGAAALVSALLYLIPQTCVLGAILLTAYLGGAVATHARVGDPTYVVPIIVGVLLWLSLFLREPRLRVMLPFAK